MIKVKDLFHVSRLTFYVSHLAQHNIFLKKICLQKNNDYTFVAVLYYFIKCGILIKKGGG